MSKFMALRSLLAAAAQATIGVSDFEGVLDALQGQVSPAAIVAVLVAAIAAGIVFVFLWWGVRKLVSIVMRAFKSGKLKI